MESSSFVVIVTALLSIVSALLGVKYRRWLDRGKLFAKRFSTNAIICNLVLRKFFSPIFAAYH